MPISSAVEAIGQKQPWNERQLNILNKLAIDVSNATALTSQEREEIKLSIGNIQKISIGQGVRLLLSSLGLEDLKKDWALLYRERSKLVHGLAPRPGMDYSALAHQAINICGRILLTAIAAEIPFANSYIDLFYPKGTS